MTEGPLAPWLADIAANILAVVLVRKGFGPTRGVATDPGRP